MRIVEAKSIGTSEKTSYTSLFHAKLQIMIRISIAEQMLYHRDAAGVWMRYPISTASKGAGNQRDSFQTPLGKHRICNKIGANMPMMTAFRAREPIQIYEHGNDNPKQDWILTRILWLGGMQTGINKRGQVDTHARYIYIHGTHDEAHIGTPVSHGCIRMKNNDIIHLFERCRLGESVYIRR